MKNDDSRRGLEVGIDVRIRMERPQSEPTVWNSSAAILMVANSQDTGFPWPTGIHTTRVAIDMLFTAYSFFFSSLPQWWGKKDPDSGFSYTQASVTLDFLCQWVLTYRTGTIPCHVYRGTQ